MKKRKYTLAVVVVITLIGIGLLYYFLGLKQPQQVKEEKVPDITMGQIILYNQGNDIIMGSDHPLYPKVKKLLEEAVYFAEAGQFKNAIIPEGDVTDPAKAKEIMKNSGGLPPNINVVKSAVPSFGAFLMDVQQLQNRNKLKINGDHIVVAIGGKSAGTLFVRKSFEDQNWQLYQVPRPIIMKMVEVVRAK
ncbi:MAG: hypothetical protein ACOY3H_07680 [Bacillota bacterium]